MADWECYCLNVPYSFAIGQTTRSLEAPAELLASPLIEKAAIKIQSRSEFCMHLKSVVVSVHL